MNSSSIRFFKKKELTLLTIYTSCQHLYSMGVTPEMYALVYKDPKSWPAPFDDPNITSVTKHCLKTLLNLNVTPKAYAGLYEIKTTVEEMNPLIVSKL